jgi:hypothetical protein
MLALLRRNRVLALVLLLLAPGVSGSAVQLLHACPADSAPAAADHQHQDAGSDQVPGCECVGECNTAGVVSLTPAVTVEAVVIRPDGHRVPLSGTSFVPVGLPSDLLPPATAPPLS